MTMKKLTAAAALLTVMSISLPAMARSGAPMRQPGPNQGRMQCFRLSQDLAKAEKTFLEARKWEFYCWAKLKKLEQEKRLTLHQLKRERDKCNQLKKDRLVAEGNYHLLQLKMKSWRCQVGR